LSRQWYVIRTKPQTEYLAATALEVGGFESFFPRVETPRPRNGHSDVPLFPGYLFLRCDRDNDGVPPLHTLNGVLGWVSFNGETPAVPDEVITDLSRRLEEINSDGGLWDRFRTGEKVRVVSGKIDGLAEVLESAKSPSSHVRVLMDFLGHQVRAQVPWQYLRPGPGQSAYTEYVSGRRRTRGKGRWIRGFGPRAQEAVDPSAT